MHYNRLKFSRIFKCKILLMLLMNLLLYPDGPLMHFELKRISVYSPDEIRNIFKYGQLFVGAIYVN